MRKFPAFFIIAVLVATSMFISDQLKENKDQRDYLKDLGLVLTGKVESVDVPEPFNGFGIVNLSIIQTNKSFYDPRKDHKFYYCLIKNGQAEIYQFYVDPCQPGDIVKVNCNTGIFTIQKKDTTIERDIILYTNERFYDYVRKHHQKF